MAEREIVHTMDEKHTYFFHAFEFVLVLVGDFEKGALGWRKPISRMIPFRERQTAVSFKCR